MKTYRIEVYDEEAQDWRRISADLTETEAHAHWAALRDGPQRARLIRVEEHVEAEAGER